MKKFKATHVCFVCNNYLGSADNTTIDDGCKYSEELGPKNPNDCFHYKKRCSGAELASGMDGVDFNDN